METTTPTRTELDRIFSEGHRAFRRNEPIGGVPYDWGTDRDRNEEWVSGWYTAQDEARDPESNSGNDLNHAGGGYARDSRGNYREAFWAGSP